MEVKKLDDNKFWFIIGICLLSLMLFQTCIAFNEKVGRVDVYFVYNRAKQMLDCIKDGRVPWFYYNDFNGVGYGSSFFYGQLTMYPFLIFAQYGYEVFTRAYLTVSVFMLFFGFITFYKRYRKDYVFFSVLTIFSTFFMELYGLYSVYQSVLGVGISFVFLAFCVDFFRDGKSFIKASITFFILLNTHILTSVFSFLGCCVLMLLYFDKKRFLEYIKFALFTCLICSYTVTNILWHSDILTSLNTITEHAMPVVLDGSSVFILQFPVGGIFTFFMEVPDDAGTILVNWVVFALMSYNFIKARKNIRSYVVLVLSMLGIITGISVVHTFIARFITPFWRIPIRYLFYVLVALFLVCFNKIDIKRYIKVIMFVSLIPCVWLFTYLSTVCTDNVYKREDYFLWKYVVGGEFLDSSFVWDVDEFMQLSSQTGFTVNKDEISYEASGEETVRFPKLYYRGYKAWTEDGTELPVEMGYSQFINVKTAGYKGEVTLKYCHPIWLQVLGTFCYLIFDVTLVYLVWRSFKCQRKIRDGWL